MSIYIIIFIPFGISSPQTWKVSYCCKEVKEMWVLLEIKSANVTIIVSLGVRYSVLKVVTKFSLADLCLDTSVTSPQSTIAGKILNEIL